MKKLFLVVLFSVGQIVFAQNFKITYKTFFEGKENPKQDPVIVFTNAKETFILSEKTAERTKEIPFEIQKINRADHTVSQYAFLQNNLVSEYQNKEILAKQKFELKSETKKILGYLCKKAVTSINSNTMEIWYTDDLKVKGGPSILGQDLGLVLEITRNGNSTTKATEISKVKNFTVENIFAKKKITSTDELSYKELLWKSRFTTVPIFENETINFTNDLKSDEKILRFAKGTVILKKVKYPKIEANSNVFVELTEQSAGDAYDRTGTVFIIPQNKEKSFFDALQNGPKTVPAFDNGNGKTYQGVAATEIYEPALELMRFFTPFGIQQFNHLKLKDKNWHDKVMYRQDISDLKEMLSGKEFWTGVFIGNYDKNGHKISLEVTLHKDGLDVFKNNTAIPLFNTLNIMEMAGQDYATMFDSPNGLTTSFTLTKDLKNAKLRYITTGHGGWENGDEFLPKENRILVDGKEVFSFIPWRTDCGSYRLYNPASGNFANGLSSSDYSRSNWCPGTTTNPNYISLGDLKAGNHQIQILIPQGKREGNSFSSWNVSGVLLGDE
ncbi:GLPGLI family protein [Chryseobacterium sp. MDT2-18]|uniref:GLPGLI family protein n=1 Tax=Chryseobacterium sp. MDT2-18 TaxID=1259136 RepID=UPI0027810155|nr:GLPGLI family protein [Chryseobacterium sp. MDT2-18]MDQ0478018.1 GLPGLI family protein [Chryseobacterium sp. MDT2-18]